MTSISHLLPDFSSAPPDTGGSGLSDDAVEDIRLQAFENGYNAGWEDGSKANKSDEPAPSELLRQKIADLEFTYHEALAKMLESTKPLIDQIIQAVLPTAMRETMGERIADELFEIAETAGNVAVKIVCSPADKQHLDVSLPTDGKMPLTLETDPSLNEGQVELRFEDSERLIDLSGVISGIEAAANGFFDEQQKEAVNE
ncbi:hypothetical protein [Poseidonocella sedimentorum]|uniref:Flagellar assembly protein FliH n=1 Tax=Poseidonocella sedimentorum TaxID=871652 RepID=A0A1I6D5U1_9RHOB|nr:hypothetical protein [Poseidonocella sedimentorum]SFR00753.1 flagellar assembly protein FliH [Poseidonocella sedimentorum]